jgi:hypothetical protein
VTRPDNQDESPVTCRAEPDGGSAFDQPHVAGAWALLGIFRSELHTLAFPQQFEDGAAHRAAVEEVLDSTFVADESETLVDQ